MHEHEHVDALAEARPKADRAVAESTALSAAAAAAGRGEVVGPAGLLHLQRAAGNAAVGRSPVLDVVSSGGGSPLDADTRVDMESRFGQDFSGVRVHTGGDAHESAVAVNAHAYTVGSDIVFQQGRYDPSSDAGRHTLAHELTHVVQQRSGPVDGTDTGSGVRVSDPSDRFEREAVATADHVLSMTGPAESTAAAPTAAVAGGAVQREAASDEEEEVAQTYVQRDADEEEHLDESVE
jgi:hypothetical protein